MQGQEGAGVLAEIKRDLTVVARLEDARELYSKGYGDLRGDYELVLRPYEALYLVEMGKLRVLDGSGRELGFNQLLDLFSNSISDFWLLYVIYRDLKRRGYIVKEGFGQKLAYRVYEKGRRDHARYLVYPFFEGEPVRTSNLLKHVRLSMSKDRLLVVAVVERRGEVIYYLCSETNLVNV